MSHKDNTIERHKIYVVFITTNTNMGKLIRLFTRNPYSHVAIALDSKLCEMYSFARYHINSPIRGGFVVEVPDRYLFDNQDVTIKVCELPVSDDEYNRMLEEISYFKKHKEIMIYNTLNAVLSLLRKRVYLKNTYTCIEFVTHLLRYPNVLAIRELEQRLSQYEIYCGSFKDVVKWEEAYNIEDDFFRRRQVREVLLDTINHFRKIVVRLLVNTI